MKKEAIESDNKITRGTIRGIGIHGITDDIKEVYLKSEGAKKEWKIKNERVANLQVKIVGTPNKDNTMSAIYDDITKGLIK